MPKYIPTLEDLWPENRCKYCGEDILEEDITTEKTEFCDYSCESNSQDMIDMWEDEMEKNYWQQIDKEMRGGSDGSFNG